MQSPTRTRAHERNFRHKVHRVFSRIGTLVMLSAVFVLCACSLTRAAAPAFRLDTPMSTAISVANELHLTGVSSGDKLMVSLWRAETVSARLYAQQQIPVHNGRFDSWIWLPWGSGQYTVEIWRWEARVNAYVQLASLQVTATSNAPPIHTSPVKLGAFDTTVESIMQPALVYSRVAGHVPLHVQTKHSQLLLEILKDGVIEQYVLPAIKGEIQTYLWLSRGAGRYDLTLWAPTADGRSFTPWAIYAVENMLGERLAHLNEAPYWYGAAWQRSQSMLQIAGLEALYGGATGITSGRLQISGLTFFTYLTATVEKDGETARYNIPVNNGRFTADLWLRFGPGVHTITIWADEAGQGRLQALVRFAARGAAADTLRYLAPARGIESDDPTIKQLAAQITRDVVGDRQRVLAIHDWVSSNISYDVAKFEQGFFHPYDGALRTLQLRKGVCQDYTYLTVALLRAIGIEARIAVGQAYSGGITGRETWVAHAWTEAKVADRWVVLDTTWDAGYVTPAGRFVKQLSHQYFDPDPAVFARDHVLEHYEY